MSQSPPDELTRDELEREVGGLREQVQDMQTDIAFLKKAVTTLTDADLGDDMGVMALSDAAEETRTEIDDLRIAVESHGDTLASIADVGEDKSSEGEKVAAIVAYADQSRGQSTKVVVTPKEIAGTTGCSKRYAYDLVDKIGGLDEGGGYDDGQHPWAAVREAETVTTGKGDREKPKGLKIDFDRVQRDPGALNQFNNGSGGNGSE
ncbi:hypothetical protein [Halococcus sp. PRR34]|uniref:hypothetical protein n=1 Tax=Halococcus sp. PRR34 TaxID=3020830 RepID=UPI00235FC2E4|nr:hypothetical protein [Halococcus sp. PRR34]